MVLFQIESDRGHDERDVPEENVQEEVEDLLKDGDWATLENKDGQTSLLIPKDLPKSEDEAWAERFKAVKSVTATKPARGG